MRLLLDTHAIVWWVLNDQRLPPRSRQAISAEADEVLFSIASVWEIAIKLGIGKMPEARHFIDDLRIGKAMPGFILLGITPEHAVAAGLSAIPHKDPFDRLLIAQAQLENLTLISNERLFDSFGVVRLWN